MERKVGEIFNANGTILQVCEAKESDECNGCFFEDIHPRCLPYICAAKEREDGKNVQFKKISKTTITRENAKELLPILQAFAEGKQIQDKIEGVTDWVDTDEINFEYEGQKIKHRIKPESQYRPFKSQEECWNEMLKHQPFGWLKSIKKQEKVHIGRVFEVKDFALITLSVNEGINNNPSYFFDEYTFADGTPFGIKKEE